MGPKRGRRQSPAAASADSPAFPSEDPPADEPGGTPLAGSGEGSQGTGPDRGLPAGGSGELDRGLDGPPIEVPEPVPEVPVLPPEYRPPRSRVAEHLKQTTARTTAHSPLDVDPRTHLPLISVPPEHQEDFKELMGGTGSPEHQVLLHIFEPVRKAVERGTGEYEDAFILLTDQTLFMCKANGMVTRCTQVSKFRGLVISETDHIAFLGPQPIGEHGGEHDILIQCKDSQFSGKPAREVRNDVVTVFSTIYKHLTGKVPNVNPCREIDPDDVHLTVREGFRLVCTPQRTRAHLRKALKNFEEQQQEALAWVEDVQRELEEEHKEQIDQRDEQILALAAQLQEAHRRQEDQKTDIVRLREACGLSPEDGMPRGKVILTEDGLAVDAETGEPRDVLLDEDGNMVLGQDGQPIPVDENGNPLDPKDQRIQELERTLLTLKIATERRVSEDKEVRFQGTFFERDLVHEVPQAPTRSRGASLHMQGLVEVLQNQVDMKNVELEDLREQVLEVEELRGELRMKDATINALQSQAQAAGGLRVEDQDLEVPGYAGAPGEGDGFVPPYYAGVPQSSGGDRAVTFGNTPDFFGSPGGLDGVGYGAMPPPDAMFGGGGFGGGGQPETRIVRRKKSKPGGARLPFQQQPFQSTLPPTPEQLTVDPRTGLNLIDVPLDLQKEFRDLDNCVMHFFEKTLKYGRKGRKKPEKRILIITDNNLFQCMPDGLINRCSFIKSVEEILVDDTNAIGFKMTRTANDYDMLYQLNTKEQQAEVVHIVTTLQRAMKMKEAPVHHLKMPIDQNQLQLQKTKEWRFKLHSVRSRRALWNELKEQEQMAEAKHNAQEQARAQQYARKQMEDDEDEYEEVEEIVAAPRGDANYTHQVADAYTQRALESLRGYLKTEFAAKKEQEYQRLRDRIRELEEENEVHLEENKELKGQWKTHRCSREQPLPNIPSRMTEGMYWIPTEPLIIECSTEVLKVQFWDNILITSHPNGFLNVWDINTADLIRTLKDHTARVVAFQYDGVELVSGSYDSTIRRWNVTDGSCVNWIQAHRGQITCLHFDRHILVSGATDATIQVWQMDIELRNLKTLRGHKAAVQALHFENNYLASCEWGWVFVWDMNRGVIQKALRDDQGGITTVAYRDGYLLTGGQAGVLTLWSVDTGDYDTLEGHTDDITHIQLEGPYAVTSAADCTIRMWSLQEFKALGVFNNSYPNECKSFQFIANRFVAAEKKTVKVWTK
eukprot:Hpha_TRINITY_DN16207_c0_g4::TRINITY_DN16207_c0_g4_i2::g.16395::m.16395